MQLGGFRSGRGCVYAWTHFSLQCRKSKVHGLQCRHLPYARAPYASTYRLHWVEIAQTFAITNCLQTCSLWNYYNTYDMFTLSYGDFRFKSFLGKHSRGLLFKLEKQRRSLRVELSKKYPTYVTKGYQVVSSALNHRMIVLYSPWHGIGNLLSYIISST